MPAGTAAWRTRTQPPRRRDRHRADVHRISVLRRSSACSWLGCSTCAAATCPSALPLSSVALHAGARQVLRWMRFTRPSIVQPLIGLSHERALARHRARLIDGAVNEAPRAPAKCPIALRHMQSGNIRSYAGWVAVGCGCGHRLHDLERDCDERRTRTTTFSPWLRSSRWPARFCCCSSPPRPRCPLVRAGRLADRR